MWITPLPVIQQKIRWWHWPAAVAGIEIAWFGMLWPLVPRTLVGGLILAAMPLPVAAYSYLAILGLFWISARTWPYWIRRSVGILIAASVGVAIFGIILASVETRRGDFGYHWFHGT